jgi:hypothetical protein
LSFFVHFLVVKRKEKKRKQLKMMLQVFHLIFQFPKVENSFSKSPNERPFHIISLERNENETRNRKENWRKKMEKNLLQLRRPLAFLV